MDEEMASATSRVAVTVEIGLGRVTPMAAIADESNVEVGDAPWTRVGEVPGGGSMAIPDQHSIRGDMGCREVAWRQLRLGRGVPTEGCPRTQHPLLM